MMAILPLLKQQKHSMTPPFHRDKKVGEFFEAPALEKNQKFNEHSPPVLLGTYK